MASRQARELVHREKLNQRNHPQEKKSLDRGPAFLDGNVGTAYIHGVKSTNFEET